MTRPITILCVVLGIALGADAGSDERKDQAAPRLVLSEVQPGTMASEQYCLVAFADRTFHAERASRKLGKDRDRKVYEGELSEADWNALGEILDSKEFRDLHVTPALTPLVIEDAHSYAISVARGKGFQNMEFVDNKSRKPYDPQLKPLLQWWKSMRNRRMPQSEAPTDPRCALDSTHGVFSY